MFYIGHGFTSSPALGAYDIGNNFGFVQRVITMLMDEVRKRKRKPQKDKNESDT